MVQFTKRVLKYVSIVFDNLFYSELLITRTIGITVIKHMLLADRGENTMVELEITKRATGAQSQTKEGLHSIGAAEPLASFASCSPPVSKPRPLSAAR